MLGCMLRMPKEHVIVFNQVVPGIIMLYCGYPDIIWDIMTTMRLVNSKRVIKAYAADMDMWLRRLQPGESKQSVFASPTTRRTHSGSAWSSGV